jgi:hypothetical protein
MCVILGSVAGKMKEIGAVFVYSVGIQPLIFGSKLGESKKRQRRECGQ